MAAGIGRVQWGSVGISGLQWAAVAGWVEPTFKCLTLEPPTPLVDRIASTRPAKSSSTLHHPPNKLLTRAYVRAVAAPWCLGGCRCAAAVPSAVPTAFRFQVSTAVLLLDSVYSGRIRPIPSHYPVSLHPGPPQPSMPPSTLS
ncbi:hypothetical protein BKA56DRAFT_607112 [Ilyonectria sp. MPI-CAGE-AT-0026]|nr:hypothetical protein BKA56DRAFT_607112 [Ilyonectria sp. MPI-CAGE-AT-0026]